MLLYVDAFSNDEIVSDSYDITYVFDNVGGEVKSNYIVIGGENIDVGCGNAFGGTDEDNEGTDDQAVKVLDVVNSFKYNV
jgi:hypothetical protein